MMKKIAGAFLAGLTAMMITTTAFAGQFVGGYHISTTDDCSGHVNNWSAASFPVDIDLETSSAIVKVYNSGDPIYYNFNRKTGPNQYQSDEGWVLEVFDNNNLRMITYDGVTYICR